MPSFFTLWMLDRVKFFHHWIAFERCKSHTIHETIVLRTTSDYKHLSTKKISSHRKMAPSSREKDGEEGDGRGSHRPPNHIVSDLVGHAEERPVDDEVVATSSPLLAQITNSDLSRSPPKFPLQFLPPAMRYGPYSDCDSRAIEPPPCLPFDLPTPSSRSEIAPRHTDDRSPSFLFRPLSTMVCGSSQSFLPMEGTWNPNPVAILSRPPSRFLVLAARNSHSFGAGSYPATCSATVFLSARYHRVGPPSQMRWMAVGVRIGRTQLTKSFVK